jgi:transposase-like protein
MKDLLVILGILIFCFDLYRLLRGNLIQRFLKKKKGAAQPRKPLVMKPKSERDCPFCVKENGRQGSPKPEMPSVWRLRKGRGGPIKKISTQGRFCPNPECEYFGITDESIHALVGYGSHEKQEPIQDLKCQACGKKFTSRRNTILYRLKTHASRGLVEKIMWLLALGVDASALEEVLDVREITIRTWLCRSGMQGKKLHGGWLITISFDTMKV